MKHLKRGDRVWGHHQDEPWIGTVIGTGIEVTQGHERAIVKLDHPRGKNGATEMVVPIDYQNPNPSIYKELLDLVTEGKIQVKPKP